MLSVAAISPEENCCWSLGFHASALGSPGQQQDPAVLAALEDVLVSAGERHAHLAGTVETLPRSPASVSCTADRFLLLKATSAAALDCLETAASCLLQASQAKLQHKEATHLQSMSANQSLSVKVKYTGSGH